jgi:hypothetical protein
VQEVGRIDRVLADRGANPSAAADGEVDAPVDDDARGQPVANGLHHRCGVDPGKQRDPEVGDERCRQDDERPDQGWLRNRAPAAPFQQKGEHQRQPEQETRLVNGQRSGEGESGRHWPLSADSKCREPDQARHQHVTATGVLRPSNHEGDGHERERHRRQGRPTQSGHHPAHRGSHGNGGQNVEDGRRPQQIAADGANHRPAKATPHQTEST